MKKYILMSILLMGTFFSFSQYYRTIDFKIEKNLEIQQRHFDFPKTEYTQEEEAELRKFFSEESFKVNKPLFLPKPEPTPQKNHNAKIVLYTIKE